MRSAGWRPWRPPRNFALPPSFNHPAGQAVANALELRHILDPGFRPTLPACLTTAFPRLAGWSKVEDGREDATLFN
jgi:hypothetical protein